tara:strand:- start:134 stop:1378 length:1245 start_codon:yes stop_codon:yes gene_type:complete
MHHLLKMILCTVVLLPLFIAAQNGKSKDLPLYQLKLGVFPEENGLEAEVEIKIKTNYFENDTLQLYLNPAAIVHNLQTDPSVKLSIAEMDEARNRIILTLLDKGLEKVTLNMGYSLKIPVDHQVNRITEDWVELNIDSFWLPFIDGFPKFEYEMALQIDSSYTVTTGDQLSKSDANGGWLIVNSIPRLDVSFTAAKKFHTVQGEFVEVYALHSDTKIDSVKIVADNVMHFLNGYIDAPKDFREKRKIVVSPREDVGYSRKNYIVLSDIRNRKAISLAGFLCHEFAHYWFSEANASTKHHWLSESFAEYLSMVFVREVYGLAEYDANIKEKQKRIENDAKVLADYEERPSYLAMYVKGPLILHQFENYLGKEKFKQLINSFVDLNIKTNEELFELIETRFGNEAVLELKRLRAII